MKRKTISVLFILMLFMPVMNFAFETLTTVYVDGLAPMSIDGNLDDWEGIDVQEVPLTQQLEGFSTREIITINGDVDLSFSFKCFADARYVYVAMMVKDDDIIIGNSDFGEGWKHDSPTVYFDGDCIDISKPYFDANDGQLKVIGAPPDGVAYIEGLIPYFYEIQVPYFWESRGIKAGFKQYDTGYNVEIAIPLKVLGWNNIEPGKTMGMNIRTVDIDHDMDADEVEKGLLWGPDPDHTLYFKTENYNRVVFAKAVSMPGVVESGVSGGMLRTVGSEARELELELSTPDYTDGTELLAAVLEDIATERWDAAEIKLASVKDAIWAQPMLGVVQLKANKCEQGTSQLLDFVGQCPDDYAVKWAKKFLKNDAKFLYIYYSGQFVSDNQLYVNMISILQEYIKHFPDDIEAKFKIANYLEEINSYENAINYYNQIEKSSANNADILKARIGIAENLFLNGDYFEAKKLAEELINNSNDSKTILGAQMILLSVEQKTSN